VAEIAGLNVPQDWFSIGQYLDTVMAATYVPARRPMLVEPIVAVRSE
jgi:hypothetical protein